MLYAWIDGVKRPPLAKGERTACRDCGGLLSAVLPVENVRHWRHKAGDCDPWSEPEGPWHLGWKECFDLGCREVGLPDEETGELHRADVLCGSGTPAATVLELQHSSISEEERAAREAFYMRRHRMFWLVHVYSTDTSFTGDSFKFSLDFERPRQVDHNTFYLLRWVGRSKQFIEKWKRAKAAVAFDYRGHIFFLAGEALGRRINGGLPLAKGQFALCRLTQDQFIRWVQASA
ncbi:hypothetical protein DMC25_23210 [Caulobacter sp. D4A]|uniref:hypothetical protein n=1 Tax=unclassified Caulobacter TaxID=2648921 RepID=UPI000D734E20|nr:MULTISPECIES: hypothetical protein [unclassified Caulobacter]PXA77588.1 hypothetical protein DMC25_23210 [Caulobacter sp. D4A]PXA96144.1 hypothetical protein DMC18_02120 [Caulobacter sp. D5]